MVLRLSRCAGSLTRMNVIGTRPDGWWKDRHGAMVRLVGRLERWATDSGEEVTVVF
jgi:hypothetical protein